MVEIGFDQVGIACTGAVAVFLTQSRNERWRRFACLFGLAGQPFWLYAAWSAEQWGILLVSVLYTGAWAHGLWWQWIRPQVRA